MADQVNPVPDHRPPGDRPPGVKPPDKPEEMKPSLSLSMSSDEYVARVKEENEAALGKQEEAMNKRHEREQQLLERRFSGEKSNVVEQRKASDQELQALKKYVDMWKRQAEEDEYVPDYERDALRVRHDREHMALIRETGFEIRQPPVGDTTIVGFPHPIVRGHPWIRPAGLGEAGRLHPSL